MSDLLRIQQAIQQERIRQSNTLSMIASESIPWPSVEGVYHNPLSSKYAEGYPGARYYGGCENADVVESIAIDAAKRVFGASYANVQPLSGSNANLAVYLALLKPGDSILGMSLKSGGHLTHGASVSLTGKWFNPTRYHVEENGKIDYDKLLSLARDAQPKIIIAGVSAYPRALDIQRFREIADSVGAKLMVDMAHVAGLVAGGAYQNPVQYADVVTTTTHKTLRGPRGGMILSRDPELGVLLDRAVFPGLQGGPSVHSIAAKAAMLSEDYSKYAPRLITNARAIARGLRGCGVTLVADYDGLATDTHMLLVDLRSCGISGVEAESRLQSIGVVCNKNCIPHDPGGARNPSGIRLGSTVATCRGIEEADCVTLGIWIGRVLHNHSCIADAKKYVSELCKRYPIEW